MVRREPRWTLVFTHIPSGIVATRTSDHFRNQHLAKESAIKYIKSKLAHIYVSIDPKDLIIEEIPIDPTEEDSVQCQEIERKEV